MKRAFLKPTAIVVTAFLVVALLYLFLKHIFKGANPTVTAASEAVIVTAFVSLGAVLIQRFAETRMRREASLRPNKDELYRKFFLLWARIFDQVTPKTTPEVPETVEEANEQSMALLPELLLWASNDVIARWSEFRRFVMSREERLNRATSDPAERARLSAHLDPQYFLIFERLVVAVRKDLGHSPNGLASGDVLGLWINDLDSHFTPKVLQRWEKINKANSKQLAEYREDTASKFQINQFGVSES
jgi:hypothetical protein